MDTKDVVSKKLSSYVDGLRGLADHVEKFSQRYNGRSAGIVPLHNDVSRLLAEAVQLEVEAAIAEGVSEEVSPQPSVSLPQGDGSGD